MLLRGGHGQEHLVRVVVLGHRADRVPGHGDLTLADPEEAADVDDHRLDGAVGADDHVADLTDVVPFSSGVRGHGGIRFVLLLDTIDAAAHQVGGEVGLTVLDVDLGKDVSVLGEGGAGDRDAGSGGQKRASELALAHGFPFDSAATGGTIPPRAVIVCRTRHAAVRSVALLCRAGFHPSA